MLENTSRNRGLLAGAVGVTLTLALAVGAGAVPLPDDGEVRTAAVAQVEGVEAPLARQPGDVAREAAQAAAPTTTAPRAAQASPTSAVAKPRTTTTPPTTRAPSTSSRTTEPATAAAATAAAATPAAAVTVARRTPSSAEVQAAITELKRQVGGLLNLVSPTPAQIAQAGDQVCTAFDNGQTFAQVKATGLSMIPASVTVSPPTVDWAVRQGVAMYCPGHASKLV